MFDNIRADLQVIIDKDPAARNKVEVVFTYSSFHAIMGYRVAHFLHNHHLKFCARVHSNWIRFLTGVEIHPAAVIGKGFFIDHGTGVVIGETTVIGENVTIYQGVTLGGTGKESGKRHPTVEDDVMISAGAKVLGPFTIGKGSKIGAGSVVLKAVPPYCTVVGVPGKIVKMKNKNLTKELNQIVQPDPIQAELLILKKRIVELEKRSGHYDDIYNKKSKTIGEEDNAKSI